MRYLVTDIESVAIDGAAQWFGAKKPTKAVSAKFGLDPDCLRIVALGAWLIEAGSSHDPIVTLCKTDADEAAALRALWAMYQSKPGTQETRFVTFFGRQFDLPALMRRSLYTAVPYPSLNIDRYRSPHVDLYDELTFKGTLKGHGLAWYGRRFGIGTGDKIDGADIGRLVAENTDESWHAIQEHCLSDLTITRALAERLGLIK